MGNEATPFIELDVITDAILTEFDDLGEIEFAYVIKGDEPDELIEVLLEMNMGVVGNNSDEIVYSSVVSIEKGDEHFDGEYIGADKQKAILYLLFIAGAIGVIDKDVTKVWIQSTFD